MGPRDTDSVEMSTMTGAIHDVIGHPALKARAVR
jgi:hypothetical protein